MEVRKYVQQRKNEILKTSNDESTKPLLLVGFNFIEDRMAENFKSVTPEMSRKTEILEILLLNFITHGLDLSKLNEVEEAANRIFKTERAIQ